MCGGFWGIGLVYFRKVKKIGGYLREVKLVMGDIVIRFAVTGWEIQ